MAHESDLTLRYVTEFQCTGGDCPDHCCQQWRVVMDKATYDGLEAAAVRGETSLQTLRTHVVKNKPADANSFATIGMDDNGSCPYLTADSGLCGIHRDLGESYLSPVCTIYPRQLNRIGERTELSLSLSCPVAAQMCFATVAAVEQVGLAPELVANEKYFYSYQQAEDHSDPYFQFSDLIHGILWQILNLPEYPLVSRLFFGSYFASRIEPFFFAGTPNFSGDSLANEIDLLVQPAILADWHRQYQQVTDGISLPMSIILTILVGRSRHRNSLSEPLAGIWRNYNWQDQKGATDFDFSEVEAQYCERRARLENLFGTEHDRHLTNYCANHLFRERTTGARTTLVYLQDLAIRRAILRFLIFSDPRWNELMASPDEMELTPELAAAFEAASVDMCYRFSRAIEHDNTLVEMIGSGMAEQNMQSLAHLVLLLKI